MVTTFDLYDLLLKGDKSKDLVLQAGDVFLSLWQAPSQELQAM